MPLLYRNYVLFLYFFIAYSITSCANFTNANTIANAKFVNEEREIITETNSKLSLKLSTHQPTSLSGQELLNIYNFGKQKVWSTPIYDTKFDAFFKSLSSENIDRLVAFLKQAQTQSAQFFALKSLLAGDNYDIVQNFIQSLNEHPENYQQEHCLFTTKRTLIQQWEYSCSVTTMQVFLGDLCPRYCWQVKQIPNYDSDVKDPNHLMAEQQKQMLEKYGGVASIRGDYSGTSIGIIGPLNELVGPMLGVSFYAQEINEPLLDVFEKVKNQLDRGINVPLLVGFRGTASKHFVLVMRYKNMGGSTQFLIYDPWEGMCDYVDEKSIFSGSLSPLLSQWNIDVEYYYPTY